MTKYIFESPDGGETIYRREFGEQHRERISEPSAEQYLTQRLYRWKNIMVQANRDSELQEMIERVEVYYEIKYAEN